MNRYKNCIIALTSILHPILHLPKVIATATTQRTGIEDWHNAFGLVEDDSYLQLELGMQRVVNLNGDGI